VPTLQTLINQSSTNLDVVAPIKARACDALNLVLRSQGTRAEKLTRASCVEGDERC